MPKSIAKADSAPPEDRFGIVLALSHLSKMLADPDLTSALDGAAGTAGDLVRVSKVVIFVKSAALGLVVGGSAGMDGDQELVSAAHKMAEAAMILSKPILHSNASPAPPSVARELAKARAASVVVPMRVGESNVGAIVALSDEGRVFSPTDVELLHVVASQSALAVWRSNSISRDEASADEADLIQLAQSKIANLSLLNQIGDVLSSTLDIDKLLDIALEQSMASVEADGGSLMLVNEESGRLEIAASRGIDKKWVEKTSQSVGTSIAGWVAEHGESVLVGDVHDDARFEMPFFRDHITSSASIPLKARGTIIGVLNVNVKRRDKAFDERDLELLGTVASQMAVAIENARLYARVNRRTKQLSSLLEISKTVTSTLNLDEVLRRLSDELRKLFQLDVCVLLLADELSGRFRFGYGTGLKTKRKYAYYDLAAPLAAHVKTTGRRLVLRDMSKSAPLITEVSESESLKAAIGLPLKDEGKLIGVALGFSTEARVFPKSQMEIMKSLGELGGVAIRNARVYRQKYRIAELLQQRLVPSSVPTFDQLDIGHKFLPARDVGGDYYDFFRVGHNKLGVVVADVAGSDVEAAEYTTMGKHVLRTYARESASPAEVLTRTNNLICEDTRAEMFISLFYGVVDLDKMTLKYANAGCEPPILYNARDNDIFTSIADGMLLGVKAGVVYEERETKLMPGDVIVVYTDGLTEAAVDGQRFGAHSVMQTVRANAGLEAQEIAQSIYDALMQFTHGGVTDDTAMVVLKVRESTGDGL